MWFWISFSDPTKPRGFLGVAIVNVPGSGRREGDVDYAIEKTIALGINPGGMALVIELAEDEVPPIIFCNRLLTREELEANDIGESALNQKAPTIH